MDESTDIFNFTKNYENSHYTSKYYNQEIIFHPTKITYNADLCFEVWNYSELKGVIPCHKNFVIENIPVVAAKYRDGSNFTDEKNKDGISVYKIEGYGFGPKLVCQFIAGFYGDDSDFSFDIVEICRIARDGSVRHSCHSCHSCKMNFY